MFTSFSGTDCIFRRVKCSIGDANLFTHTMLLRLHELRLNKVEAQAVSSGNLRGLCRHKGLKGVNYRATPHGLASQLSAAAQREHKTSGISKTSLNNAVST
jgi:hypothetical protein